MYLSFLYCIIICNSICLKKVYQLFLTDASMLQWNSKAAGSSNWNENDSQCLQCIMIHTLISRYGPPPMYKCKRSLNGPSKRNVYALIQHVKGKESHLGKGKKKSNTKNLDFFEGTENTEK